MNRVVIILTLIVVFYPFNLSSTTMSSDNYQIWADTFDIGGAEPGSSESYQLSETLGESIVDSSGIQSTNYKILAGFREMYPDRSLTFSVDVSSLELGTLSTSRATTGSHTMSVTTNADNGVTITVGGNTLARKDGADMIPAIGSTPAASKPGTEQFGIRLAAAGTSPIAQVTSAYDGTLGYAYNSGDIIVSSSGPINTTTLTVFYLVNIGDTKPGEYSTILTYTATGSY